MAPAWGSTRGRGTSPWRERKREEERVTHEMSFTTQHNTTTTNTLHYYTTISLEAAQILSTGPLAVTLIYM